MFVLIAVLAIAFLGIAQPEDKKWVWEDTNRNTRFSKARYETVDEDNDYSPAIYKPSYANYNPYRPSGVGQLHTSVHERPGGVYNQGAGIYDGYGHGGQHPGILTGPVPSWVKESPIKDFDKCKCAEKFNCNSPGISYGHCDVGKQYCCYVSKPEKAVGGPIPSRPVHSPENGILVGPGGPVDYPSPARPPVYHQKPIGGFGNNGNGVLVGPGGPTGVVGRPQYLGGRPTYSAQNGVLVGPGGPIDRPLRPGLGGYGNYARSGSKDK